jgi:branched-chain amino acid transport system ATP-binding protein
MLEVNNVYAGYGDLKVLYGVSFSVKEGEVVSLVGSNGAGKTTLLRILSGFVPISSGKVSFEGRDLLKIQTSERATIGIAHIPQGRGILASLSVKENLILGAYTKHARRDIKKNMQVAFESFPVLFKRQNQIAGSLSGGEQQMLAIARALMMHPKMIIMDEPSLGLAPILVDEVFGIISKIAKEGMSIFIVEQNLKQSLSIADRGYVLENGKIVLEGTAKDILKNPQIQSAYLGI